MASEVSNYQCPKCAGPLKFNIETGLLHCEYCLSTFSAEEFDAVNAKREREATEVFEKKARTKKEIPIENWSTTMREYKCPDCGAVLAADENTAVICCPYCGNNAMIPGQFSGMQRPDYVIPFNLDREAAITALKKHYKGKPFLPREFRSNNQIEKVQGVYVPFWLFDATVEAQVQFDGQIIKKRDDENKNDKIKHHDSRRAGTVRFENVPVDASRRMDDDLMDSILPYRWREKKPFSMAYFSGFLAEKYDVSVDECARRAEEQCTNSTINILAKDASKKGKYNNIEVVNSQIHFNRDALHYIMLPVWLLTTKWKGKNLTFAMNGQTGKLVGDLPISKAKYCASAIGWTVLLSAVGYLILSLI